LDSTAFELLETFSGGNWTIFDLPGAWFWSVFKTDFTSMEIEGLGLSFPEKRFVGTATAMAKGTGSNTPGTYQTYHTAKKVGNRSEI
jgi:hypothetical protein